MDDQELQHFLQHKSCIIPSSEAVEEFILEFQRRQRLSSQNLSLWSLFKERLHFFFLEFQVPRMAYVLATALALISSTFIFLHQSSNQSVTSYTVAAKNVSVELPSSTLIPQNSIIPVSFQGDSDEDALFSPDHVLPKRKLDFRTF